MISFVIIELTGSANANFGICGNDGGEKPGISANDIADLYGNGYCHSRLGRFNATSVD